MASTSRTLPCDPPLRVLVTGATGAIGRLVAPLLIETGHQVTAVGRTAEKQQALQRVGAASG